VIFHFAFKLKLAFNILTLDGTIPSTPLISTTADIITSATITAEGGISGGTF